MVCTVIRILISRIYCITIYTKFLLHWFVRRRGEMIGYQKEFSKLTWYYCMVWHAAPWIVLWSCFWVPNITTDHRRLENQKTEHIHKPNRGDWQRSSFFYQFKHIRCPFGIFLEADWSWAPSERIFSCLLVCKYVSLSIILLFMVLSECLLNLLFLVL